MTIGVSRCVAVTGVSGHVIEVRADLGHGLASITLIGDHLLADSRDRVRAALAFSGERWPQSRVILAPSAPIPADSTCHDLALAIAVLDATRTVPAQKDCGTVFFGELGLDGRLRATRATVPAVLAARAGNYHTVVVPEAALPQLAHIEGITVLGAADLRAVLAWLRHRHPLSVPERVDLGYPPSTTDLADFAGHPEAKWALQVAAAGGHHLALLGPPGSGKTLLAQCLPGILPPLTDAQALEVAAIASATGRLDEHAISRMPPYVAAHHSTSVTAMLGGGSRAALPGAVSRAHHGVLFLDEVSELSVRVREALRIPLEDGEVRIARRDGVTRYPARFQLIVAACRCACGAVSDGDCVCSPQARLRYHHRLAEPWTDRLDIWVDLSPKASPLDSAVGETSAVVRARVISARATAAHRWHEHGYSINAHVPATVLRQQFPLAPSSSAPLKAALRAGRISLRGADRVLRLAWTLCDLRAHTTPNDQDIADAVRLRRRPPLPRR